MPPSLAYEAALAGQLPAEALTPAEQDQLLELLVAVRRWDDERVAAHTKWTVSVVERKRARLGLAAGLRKEGG